MTDLPKLPGWAADDFEGTAPYEWLYGYKDDKFVLAQLLEKVKKIAGALGVKSFLTIWKAYLAGKAAQNRASAMGMNSTQYEGQPLELVTGDYLCDDDGVTTLDRFGFEVDVCPHPIMPVRRLVNIDTGIEKAELMFKRSKRWRTIIVDKTVISSAQKIVELAGSGIGVNSESARELVKFLGFIESANYNEIPEKESVGRLGWIADHGFSPYVDGVIFDGDQSAKKVFDAVKQTGSYDAWLDCARKLRRDNKVMRMMLAASFASALVNPCNALTFFFHVWGFSGTAKTVALMAAASVWADPTAGKYVQTFNSTNVGLEMKAGVCNSLPLCLDELQCIKNRKAFDDLVYMLAEGTGRTRGARTGGTQHTQTWANCVITNGEQPINTSNSGAGAVNRVIEIECGDTPLVLEPRETVATVRANYGWAGRQFAEALQDPAYVDKAKEAFSRYSAALDRLGSTDKQSMAAALVLAADELTEELIFRDDLVLTAIDIMPYLSTKDDVDQNARAYDWILDFVAANPSKFHANQYGDYQGECWGCEDQEYIYVIKSIFDEKVGEAGYNSASFLSWARRKGLIVPDKNGKSTQNRRWGSVQARCVWLKKPERED